MNWQKVLQKPLSYPGFIFWNLGLNLPFPQQESSRSEG